MTANASRDRNPGPSTQTADDPAFDLPGLGLYVHWPWCLSKCPYCDFNSHVAAFSEPARQVGTEAVSNTVSPNGRRTAPSHRPPPDPLVWAEAFGRELAALADMAPRRPISSVFFGGGTPSLMEPETVAAVLTAADHLFGLAADCEITLEANPGAVDCGRFTGVRAAGVTRLSLGVQALDDMALAFLGRRHDRNEALRALDLAQETFPQVSLDLIYARPGQTADAWADELSEALALGTDHLSLYQLTVEQGTAFFGRMRNGLLTLPTEDNSADLFELTQTLTDAAGLPAYEVSNHARPGAACRHNRDIWRGGDYLGIGPGAHGRLAGQAIRCVSHPGAWLDHVGRDGHGVAERTLLTPAERAEERVLMGLRLTEGIDAGCFARLSGLPLMSMINQTALSDLVELGLVTWDERVLAVTSSGRLCLNAVTGQLLGG